MKNIKLILVFLLSLSGISFMTPIPWTEINLEKENEPEFIEAPSSFSAILNCHTDSCKFREIDRIVQDAYEKGRFNGQILYAENGKILYNESFGYANLKDKSPLENQWRFQLASTSKPFTAMAIMKLQEAGKIDINQLVSTYLPDFPYPTVTVRNLLQHRSGIPNYIYVADKHWDYRKPITNNDLTPLLQKYAPRLEFTPGRTFKYCNSNYAYLACIIEAVSGEKFATFLQKNIFTPLNMHHTFVYDYTHPQKDSVVTGYSYSRQRGHYERPNDYL
ncbi:MAG: serine hydrolase domain-containing protein, partial [Bacteroidales bacterium]